MWKISTVKKISLHFLDRMYPTKVSTDFKTVKHAIKNSTLTNVKIKAFM